MRWLPMVVQRWGWFVVVGALAVWLGAMVPVRQKLMLIAPEQISLVAVDGRIGQTFLLDRPGLRGVRLQPVPEEPPGSLVAHVTLQAGGPPLASATAIARGRYLEFIFPQFALAPVPTVTLRLELVAPPGKQLALWGGPNRYPHGSAFVGDRTVPGRDLGLELIYEQRWLDSIWPVSRMAAGRPGLFGSPVLYALLIYLFGVALVWAAANIWRAQVDAH